MGKMTRTRRTRIAADMARMLRDLHQVSAQATSTRVPRPHTIIASTANSTRTVASTAAGPGRRGQRRRAVG